MTRKRLAAVAAAVTMMLAVPSTAWAGVKDGGGTGGGGDTTSESCTTKDSTVTVQCVNVAPNVAPDVKVAPDVNI